MQTRKKKIKSICFVAPGAYAVLANSEDLKMVGGAEVQQSILAKEFARRGYRVSMVAYDYGQKDGEEVDGVTVYKAFKVGAGIPKFTKPWGFVGMWKAMRRADADLYYQQACTLNTGYMSMFASACKRYSLYCAASDYDFRAEVPFLPTPLEKKVYKWGLRNASVIVAQSERQVRDCKSVFGLDSEVIRSGYGHVGRPASQDGVILWSGNVKSLKRPEIFVELAKRCPEYRFKLVGGGEPAYFDEIKKMADGLQNLEMTGFVPYSQVEQHFDRASMIPQTSTTEDFPNTFLQGWSRGSPSISFFDPETSLNGRRVGIVADSVDDFEAHIRRLKTDSSAWQQASSDCREYFCRHFSLEKVADAYEELFERMVA